MLKKFGRFNRNSHTTLLDRLKYGNTNNDIIELMQQYNSPNKLIINKNINYAINPDYPVLLFILGEEKYSIFISKSSLFFNFL